MPSRKRRTTSKSGSSPKSTSKDTSKAKAAASSVTAPLSFERVFGPAEPTENHRLRTRLEALLAASQHRVLTLAAQGEPRLAILRSRYNAKLSREKRLQAEIQADLATLSAD